MIIISGKVISRSMSVESFLEADISIMSSLRQLGNQQQKFNENYDYQVLICSSAGRIYKTKEAHFSFFFFFFEKHDSCKTFILEMNKTRYISQYVKHLLSFIIH